jgi:hypothetical protein
MTTTWMLRCREATWTATGETISRVGHFLAGHDTKSDRQMIYGDSFTYTAFQDFITFNDIKKKATYRASRCLNTMYEC